jgi:hypothetical protein
LYSLNLLLLGTFNNHLDALGGVNVLEGLLGVLELDTTCDQLLHAKAARGNEIKGQLVVTGSVTERSLKGTISVIRVDCIRISQP